MTQLSAHDTAVVFVTDGGYLGPSLQAALQLADQGIGEIADIIVYTIDVDAGLVEALQRRLGRNVRIVELRDKSYLPPPGVAFAKNHVPVSALARLVLADDLPAQCRNIVYLDGDIQIVGDVRALVRHRVREGWIAAGRGSAWLDPDDAFGLNPPGYIDALGGATRQSYFNSGVLACRRDTWVEYGPRALQAFFANGEAFIRHDQSALNAVFKQNVEQLSPCYNFHDAYARLGLAAVVEPKIVHFTGPSKPWKGRASSWGWRFHGSYLRLLERLPELTAVFSVAPRIPDRPITLGSRLAGFRGIRSRLAQRRAFRRYIAQANFAVS